MHTLQLCYGPNHPCFFGHIDLVLNIAQHSTVSFMHLLHTAYLLFHLHFQEKGLKANQVSSYRS